MRNRFTYQPLAVMSSRKMRILIGLVACLTLSLLASAQADCKIRYMYTWTIESETIEDIELGIPTTQFLCGYASSRNERSFRFVNLGLNQATLISHLSSDFCMDPDRIIDKVFKCNHSSYVIRLRIKSNQRNNKFDLKEYKIPIESINISYNSEEKVILIQLPTIKPIF
jgi:hypothetical protein